MQREPYQRETNAQPIYHAISPKDYIEKVLPFFQRMGWWVPARWDEGGTIGAVVIRALVTTTGALCPAENVAGLLTASLDAIHSVDAPPSKPTPQTEANAPGYEAPAGMEHRDFFDYTELRKDPVNDAIIKRYSSHKLIVKAEDMVTTVKPAFAALRWIYGGNHYGDKTVAILIVMDSDNQLVTQESVIHTLQGLDVKHHIRKEKTAALHDDEAENDDFATDEDEYEDDDEPEKLPGEDYPGETSLRESVKNAQTQEADSYRREIAKAEAGIEDHAPGVEIYKAAEAAEVYKAAVEEGDRPISQAAAGEKYQAANIAAMAEEVERLTGTGANGEIILSADDRLGLCASYSLDTKRSTVRIVIQENIVRIDCSFEQALRFLTDASPLIAQMVAQIMQQSADKLPNGEGPDHGADQE